MKKLLIILLTVGAFYSCDNAQRDVSHCPQEPTECDQYSCYFLSCECIADPNSSSEDQFLSRFKSEKEVKSAVAAKEVGIAFMESIQDTSAVFTDVGALGYSWYFVTFSNTQNSELEHLTISPSGNVYIIGCGV